MEEGNRGRKEFSRKNIEPLRIYNMKKEKDS